MDNNFVESADKSLVISILGAIFTWLMNNTDLAIKAATGLFTVISAVFAARYYYLAAKQKKIEIEILEEENKE